MACPPSARLALRFEEQTSTYADEGTLAHHLAETILLFLAHRISRDDYYDRLEEIEADGYYNAEMKGYVDDYVDYVLETKSRALRDDDRAKIWIERKLDLTYWIPESFGTSDAGVIGGPTMRIIDLKYGKGVEVSAEDNTQMKIYSLGALRQFDVHDQVETIEMTIYQPRIHNISTWAISRDELERWAETRLVPASEMAFHGRGRFRAGSHCRWCPAKGICEENRQYNMEIARFDFIDAALMCDKDVAYVLKHGDDFVKWVSDVKEYALNQAVNHGRKYPGMKIVEGRSNRVFPDKTVASLFLELEGYRLSEFTKRELLPLGDLEKLLGKRKFNEIIAPLLIKPEGKLALVPVEDKRDAWHSGREARRIFEAAED